MRDPAAASDPAALREERDALRLALAEIRATQEAVRARLAALEHAAREAAGEHHGADPARLRAEAEHLAGRAEQHATRLAELDIAIRLAEIAARRAKAARRERRRRSPRWRAFRIARLAVLLCVLCLAGGYAYLARAGRLPPLLRPETIATVVRPARSTTGPTAEPGEGARPRAPAEPGARRPTGRVDEGRPVPPTPVEELKRDPERLRRITATMQEDLRRRTTQGARTQPADTGEAPALDPNVPVVPKLTRGDAPDAVELGPFLSAHFREPEVYPVPEGLKPYNVAGADINGDGRAELVVLEFDARRVLVYERQPEGYALRAAAAVDPWPQRLVARDLTGDGRDDLVVPGGSSRSTILYSHSDWALTYQVVVVNWAASDARIADVTGDGRPDILFGNARELVLMPNAGGGIAAAGVVVQRGAFGAFGVGDLNGDGRLDAIGGPFVAWRRAPESVSIGVALLGRDGALARGVSRMSYAAPIWRYAPLRRTAAAACDVVATVAETNDVLLFRNRGDATFDVAPLGKARAGHSILVFDIDRDGWDDVLVGDRVFVNDRGELVPRARFPGLRGLRNAELADGDGDGEADLLVNGGGRIIVYPRRGPAAIEGEALTAAPAEEPAARMHEN